MYCHISPFVVDMPSLDQCLNNPTRRRAARTAVHNRQVVCQQMTVNGLRSIMALAWISVQKMLFKCSKDTGCRGDWWRVSAHNRMLARWNHTTRKSAYNDRV